MSVKIVSSPQTLANHTWQPYHIQVSMGTGRWEERRAPEGPPSGLRWGSKGESVWSGRQSLHDAALCRTVETELRVERAVAAKGDVRLPLWRLVLERRGAHLLHKLQLQGKRQNER